MSGHVRACTRTSSQLLKLLPDAVEPLVRRALGIYEAALGPAHPETRTSADILADVLEEKGLREKADELRSKYAHPTDAA